MHAQIHRFGDNVAIYLGNGATTYLDATTARKIARLLNAGARSIDREAFAHSKFGSHEFDATAKPLAGWRVVAEMESGKSDSCYVTARNAKHALRRVAAMRGVARAVSAVAED